MEKLGYSEGTEGAASRSAPQISQEEIIVTLERVRRLSLLVVILANQGNDSNNEHAELKNSFPCNIHTCHPLSLRSGAKEDHHPRKDRGEPPAGVLVAPSTAYHRIPQFARKNAVIGGQSLLITAFFLFCPDVQVVFHVPGLGVFDDHPVAQIDGAATRHNVIE